MYIIIYMYAYINRHTYIKIIMIAMINAWIISLLIVKVGLLCFADILKWLLDAQSLILHVF